VAGLGLGLLRFALRLCRQTGFAGIGAGGATFVLKAVPRMRIGGPQPGRLLHRRHFLLAGLLRLRLGGGGGKVDHDRGFLKA
jgi:hypothetical protein